jgi:hypothetical protein
VCLIELGVCIAGKPALTGFVMSVL